MAKTFVLLLFFASLIEGKAEKGSFTWHQINPNSLLHPSPRFGALTWVDDRHWLWLFAGKSILKQNKTNSSTQLNDLWKFNPKTLKWHRVPNVNATTKRPLLIDGAVCFCGGLVFSVGYHVNKTKCTAELWSYNISSNLWKMKNLPREVKNSHDCFALWCDQNQSTVSLLTRPSRNSTLVQVWKFAIKTDKWETFSHRSETHQEVKNTSELTKYVLWTDSRGTSYLYFWSSADENDIFPGILKITHTNITFIHVNKDPRFTCREGFIYWPDSRHNLHLIGGKKCNSTEVYSDQWVLDIAKHKWVSMNMNTPNPIPRIYAGYWKVRNAVFVYGGYSRDSNGDMVELKGLWVGNTSKHVVVRPGHHLPGDTLGLSMVDKFIISALVLVVVLTISIRLCYKRELNQLLSRMKRHRVPYQQLSQEADKSSRL